MSKLPPTITTERLTLRGWRDEDREPFAAMNANPQVMEHFPSLMTAAESDAMLERIERYFEQHGFGFWAVEINAGAPFIGFIGLGVPRFESHFTPCVEIGWRLAPPFWGQGLATEGAVAALDFAFGTLRLKEVVAITATCNARSERVMQRIGMKRDPQDDFDHPLVPPQHRLSRHVLYRKPAPP